MSASPLFDAALRELARDRSPRCGIHGDRIVDRRCPSCDQTRSTRPLASASIISPTESSDQSTTTQGETQ